MKYFWLSSPTQLLILIHKSQRNKQGQGWDKLMLDDIWWEWTNIEHQWGDEYTRDGQMTSSHQGQWWSMRRMHLWQTRQWCALGGRYVSQRLHTVHPSQLWKPHHNLWLYTRHMLIKLPFFQLTWTVLWQQKCSTGWPSTSSHCITGYFMIYCWSFGQLIQNTMY